MAVGLKTLVTTQDRLFLKKAVVAFEVAGAVAVAEMLTFDRKKKQITGVIKTGVKTERGSKLRKRMKNENRIEKVIEK